MAKKVKKGGSKKMAATASNDSNLMGALAYILMPLTGVLMYFVKPDDKYVRYHAVQSIILGIVLFVVGMLLNVAAGVLGATIPLLGLVIGLLVGGVWLLIEAIIWLYCMWKAYSGEKFRLPVISDLADKNS
ncbi:MAG: DUF4870 domain-containing protein [Candidatus Micrarchaeota archaeon]|nr:DUF4870 domain-containing protein [Candidatus Micrarchaeota archaeon]